MTEINARLNAVELQDIDATNWEKAIQLAVFPGQAELVPSVSISLARAFVRPDGPGWVYRPLGIFRRGRLIGFCLLVAQESRQGTAWLSGLLIDSQFQGHGLGRLTLGAVRSLLCDEYSGVTHLNLTVVEHNRGAIALYEKVGFTFTGAVHDGELVMSVEL